MAPLPNAETPLENSAAISPSAALPCNCLVSSAFRRCLPLRIPSHRDPVTPPDVAAIGHLILSAAERWTNALGEAASWNPFLKAVFSISEDLQRFVQTQCRISNSQFRSGSSPSTLKFAAILPGNSVAGLVVANGLGNFLNIYNTLLVVRLVLTWFPGAPPAIVSPLSTLCDPYLNIFRGLIPPLGGTLDLSPILAFLVLNAFTSTAAALPAELPESMKSQQHLSSPLMPLNLTTIQQKWTKRVCSKQKKHREASD